MNERVPQTTDLLDRLRRHSRPAMMGCTCRSDRPNCPACDCGHAADEIERLREDCAQFYQVIGCLAHYAKLSDDPQTVKALDNALAAADGDPRPHDDLLPFTANVRDDADA